jgi:Spy/CpxP family protein refolding chaperone
MKNRARALAVLIAVLLAGFILGIAGFHFWQQRPLRYRDFTLSSRVQSRPDGLAERLQLTADQQQQLKAILEDSRRQIEAGRVDMEKQLEAIRAQTNDRIAAMLNDEQKKMFRQYVTEGDLDRNPGGRRGDRGHRKP